MRSWPYLTLLAALYLMAAGFVCIIATAEATSATVGISSDPAEVVSARPHDVVSMPVHLVRDDGSAIRVRGIEVAVSIPAHLRLDGVALVSNSRQSVEVTPDPVTIDSRRHLIRVTGDSGRADGHQFSMRVRALNSGTGRTVQVERVNFETEHGWESLAGANRPRGLTIEVAAHPDARVQVGEVRVIE